MEGRVRRPVISPRELPSVDAVAARLAGRYPHRLVVEETRRVIAKMRAALASGRPVETDAAAEVEAALERLDTPSLRRVINATGVVLHTNLGRAPLRAFPLPEGYSNLEYDIAQGRRGKRDAHTTELLERLTGSPSIVVNNNAAAAYLVLHELAAGCEAIVSRGELIEIGDSFRVPDLFASSGAILREVGTTNRTHIADYAEAINERTRLIVRVHPSNFSMSGFTGKPSLAELSALARSRSIPLYEDLGSGCVVKLPGIDEPLVSDSLGAGASVVSFSGDKLLGGPQCGIISGEAELISRIRRNPMFRALRVDKLTIAALENTLRAILFERYDEVPALRMIRETPAALRERCERLKGAGVVIAGESVAGGGSTPGQTLAAWLIAFDGNAAAKEKRLRLWDPPVIARVADGRLLIDLRTVAASDEGALSAALQALS